MRGAGLGMAAGVDEFHGFLPWRLLLLLFFLVDKGHLGVALSWLLLEEGVDLVVGLGDYFSCPGSTSPVTSRDLLLRRGVHQGSQVPGSEVGQLDRKLGVLQNAVSEDLLVPKADVGVTLEHLGVLPNVGAAGDLTAGSDVLEVEEATVLVALVSKSKVDAGAVLSSGPHEVGHDAGDVERQLAFRLLGHICDPDLLPLLSMGAATHVSGYRPDLP